MFTGLLEDLDGEGVSKIKSEPVKIWCATAGEQRTIKDPLGSSVFKKIVTDAVDELKIKCESALAALHIPVPGKPVKQPLILRRVYL